ncbi:MAG: Hsp20/alpha crystallin family protein [Anaerolineae bacterium]|jgi:HSP20 family protein
MSLMRRDDPFYSMNRMMSRMFDQMRTMMDEMLLPLDGELSSTVTTNPLAIDLSTDDTHVTVRTAVPGFKEDDIHIDVRGNVLTISAESKVEREDNQSNWHIRELRYGKFARSVQLPEEVIADKAEATLENGILTVKLPKHQPSPVQRIMVKARNLLKGGENKS